MLKFLEKFTTTAQPTTTSNNSSLSKKEKEEIKKRYDEQIFKGMFFLLIGIGTFIYGIYKIRNKDVSSLKPGTEQEGINLDHSAVLSTIALIGLTIAVLSISWLILVEEDKEKPVDDKINGVKFFDLTSDIVNIKNVIIGMTQGFVFGTIDNFGMSLGIDGIEQLLGNSKVLTGPWIPGLSNLYSSLFGSIMGSCLEKAIKKKTDVNDTPWWGNLIGIIFGSVVGILLSQLIVKKKAENN